MAMPPGFGDRMQVDVAASERSSSSISSPPLSPQNNGFSDTIRVAHPPFANPQLSTGGGVANAASANSAQPASAANTSTHAHNNNNPTSAAANANGAVPEKPKRQRKKKEVGPDGKPVDDGKPKEKKPRKPREPKDKTAGTTTSAPRKKQKVEEKTIAHDAPTTGRQPTITEMVNFHPPAPPTSMPMPARPQHSTSTDSVHRNSLGLPASGPPTPRPVSSGHYDPVRGYDPVRAATMETAQSRPANASNATNGTPSAQASPRINRASASPSIASLIDPPMAAKMSAPAISLSSHAPMQQPFVPSHQRSPIPSKPTPATFLPPPAPQSPPPIVQQPAAIPTMDGAMDIELICDAPKAAAEVKAPSRSSSSAPTPKAVRPTPPPAPKGTGSGLLSSSDLFGGPSSNEGTERKGVNIDLHIPLNPQGGNTINIAQEIFRKYGRDAINPRAAAHRERLLQIQAAANKIDGGSADDMSVDLMSDVGDDSNVEMGGMDDEGKSGPQAEGGDAKPRKRRKKVEEYDKEDDFIDDTELAWQEQAAVAKDGFFVYSGPLVPAGEAAQVESSAPTRGGRARGRGRGRGAAAAAAGTTHASLAEKSRDPNAPPTRARGRGRGTGAPRKPRITKADRERMEAEKMDRERTAAHIGGPTGAPIALAPTPTPQAAVPQTPLPPSQQQQQQQQGYQQQVMGAAV